MSADGFFAQSDADLSAALIAALRADPDVQALLGDPARVFDDDTQAPIYPYAVLERHERYPANAALVYGAEHRFRFATYSRFGGRAEARELLGVLRAAIDNLNLALAGQRVVSAMVTYSDAMRTADIRAFRGVLRVRIVTEEA